MFVKLSKMTTVQGSASQPTYCKENEEGGGPGSESAQTEPIKLIDLPGRLMIWAV